MSIVLELSEKQAGIFEEVRKNADKTAIYLAGLSCEERLNWLKMHQYCYPISFEREINGTIYTVNAYFSGKATETVERKVDRILNKDITH